MSQISLFDVDIWQLSEATQRELLDHMRTTGVPEGRRNDLFIRRGYVLLLLRFYPDSWVDIGREILVQGIENPRKKRERRLWWDRHGVRHYQQALADGHLSVVHGPFSPSNRYRSSEVVADEIERLLNEVVTSDTVLLSLIDLVLYMLDLQVEAERHEQRVFFRGLVDMVADLETAYHNVQTLSKHMPFVVKGFRADESGHDRNIVPIFLCVSKAKPWAKGQPRKSQATAYQLNDKYRYLLEMDTEGKHEVREMAATPSD